MGKHYRDNRDGYVYVYAPNGRTEGAMNQLVMFRVPKGKILNDEAYEYFAGLLPDGNAHWSRDISARQIVHAFPSGLVPLIWPLAWLPSVGWCGQTCSNPRVKRLRSRCGGRKASMSIYG